MKNLRRLLLRNRIAPKWAVFALDSSIAIAAILYANYLILSEAHFTFYNVFDDVVAITISNAVLFYVFRTYQGIIRFSDFHEAFRSVAAIFYSAALLLVANTIIRMFFSQSPLSYSVLIIYFFVASFLIFGYRMLIKHLYKISLHEEDKINVVIYGAELNASLLIKTIEQNSNHQHKILAFIDNHPDLIGKTIDDVKIYTFDQIKTHLKEWEVKILVFAKDNIDVEEKSAIVDVCLEHQIKVLNVPPISEWMKGNLNVNQLQEVKIEELLGRPTIQLRNDLVVQALRNKRILITGASGSIGSELARQVASLYPAALIICDQTESGLYELEYELQQKYQLGHSLKIYLGDIKDQFSMRAMFEEYQPEIVFHAAAYKHVPMMERYPSEAIRNNVLGTKILADLSEEFEVERFLLVSTDKAINPTNVMGASKRLAEIYCNSLHHRKDTPVWDEGVVRLNGRRSKTKFIITRFGNVLGSNGSVIPRFQQQIAKGGPVTVTHPDIIRYFMTIPEACSLVLEAITMGKGGEVFLFDMGEPVKILDLAKKMIKLAGRVPGKDIEIKFTGLRPGEKLYEELLNKEEEVIPTHHKKILIAKVMEYDYDKVKDGLDTLFNLAFVNKNEEVVKQMKRMVPEFISNNSIYESIDLEVFRKVGNF